MDDIEMQNSQAEVQGGDTTPVERNSWQPSSSTTLAGLAQPDTPRMQPIPHQPRVTVMIPEERAHSKSSATHYAVTTPSPHSTPGPQITPQPAANAGSEGIGDKDRANVLTGKRESFPEVQTVQVLGQPTGWAAMAEDIRKYDEDRVKECRDDIDTLMTFAGLFSAAITAFLVESYQALLPNKADETLQVLRLIAQQNSIVAGQASPFDFAMLSGTAASGTVSSGGLVLVNILWFASLTSSLVAASFSMLVKHWLREYLTVSNPSAQARLRVRRCREPSLAVWKVFEIAAALPFLLQLALALFFAGLCIFTTSVHTTVGRTTTALVCAWAFCFLAVTLLPIFFPRCPYKTTFLSRFLRWAHLRLPQRLKSNNYLDEKTLTSNPSFDLEILADVDALQGDDELLGTTILESIGQFHRPELSSLSNFLRQILNHRCQLVRASDVPWAVNSDLRSLTDRGRRAIRDIIARYVHAEDPFGKDEVDAKEASPIDQICAFLLSPNLQPLSTDTILLLRKRLDGRARVGKVFTALLQQLEARCTERGDWHNTILDTLRYTQDILHLNFDQAFKQFLHVMDTYYSYMRPNSPQKDTLYSWVEAFSPEGIADIGGFLCESTRAELKRRETLSADVAGDRPHSLGKTTRCALYLKQFLDTRNPGNPAAMRRELSSLLAITLSTKDQTLAGAILVEFIQQKDTLFEQVLPAVLADTREQFVESGQLDSALSNFNNLIRSNFLEKNMRTLNRYLKLCFIAVCLVSANDSKASMDTYGELFASFSTILSQCLSTAASEPSGPGNGILPQLCLTRLRSSAILHDELTTVLGELHRIFRPSSNMALVPARNVSGPSSVDSPAWRFTEALDRSRTANTFQHAMKQAARQLPRRKESVTPLPVGHQNTF